MSSVPIELPWSLPTDHLIDIFIIQFRTPVLEEAGACKSIDSALGEKRQELLSNFGSQLIKYLDKKSQRPLFIITPELSLPFSCQKIVKELVESAKRPVVFIAGYEFLNHKQYLDLIASSALPEKSKWTESTREGTNFNVAGIWLGDGNGKIDHYIQTKTSPSRPEHASVFSGSNLLFFMTPDQSNGKRLNFAVQICSDFTSDEKVENFRKSLGATSPSLDITFLLQCNPDQEAIAFKSGIKHLFKPPSENMIETSNGCIVLVNNANEVHGRSIEWGQSKVCVKFTQGWDAPTKFPQPTYFAKNQGGFDYQEMVFRESGQGIYRLTYKPRYMQNVVPGSVDEFPFNGGHVEYAKIEGNTLQPFIPLHPTIHWLNCHWLEVPKAIHAAKKDPAAKQAVLDFLLSTFSQVHETIMTNIGFDELKARQMVGGYYMCHFNFEGYPFKPPEPNDWIETVQTSISKLLEAYSLTFLGTQKKLTVHIDSLQHAAFEDILVIFIFAGGQTIPGLLQKFRSEITSKKKTYADRQYLLVLIDSEGQPSKNEAIKIFEETELPITKAESTLKISPGHVVKPQPKNKIHILYSSELHGKKQLAPDAQTLETSLAQLISEQFQS